MRRVPPMPERTCPDIDAVIDMCDGIWKQLSAATAVNIDFVEAHRHVSAAIDLLDGIDYSRVLEDLRQANDALRQNAEHYMEEAEELKKSLTAAEERAAQAEEDAHEANKSVNTNGEIA